MDQRPTVHVVDDDDAVCDSMGLMLEIEGFVVRTYASAVASLREAHLAGNHCLIVDMHMPGISGVALLDQLRRNGINVPAIVMTSMANKRIRRAVEQVNSIILEKPYSLEELIHSIEVAVRSRENLRVQVHTADRE
jgi:two-component system, LuxR family, response regulator FixJ